MRNLVPILLYALNIYSFLILVRVLVSWMPQWRHNVLVEYLEDITDPVLGPVSRFLPPISGIDLSPLVVLLAIQLVQELLRMTLVS